MRQEEIYNGGYYHIYNRGVDKRHIFNDKQDRERFLLAMNVLNDANFIPNKSIGKVNLNNIFHQRNPYVRIICYSLMENHYHFELEQLAENGISLFMARLSNSYTKYFNTKHNRKGRLFESSYQAKNISNDDYLLHVTRYIHLNPLDLHEPGWKKSGISDWTSSLKFLKTYPWSSCQSYMGIKKDPIIDHGILKDMIKSPTAYINFLQEWAEQSFNRIHPLTVD